MPQIRRALISVTDKTGLAEFARALSQLSIEIISTGGTARLLRDSGIPVRDVSEVTGFPEMLDGRVKTMHPVITGAILAIRANPAHMSALQSHSIEPIDLVVVNLYEFEKVAARPGAPLHELIENIDIGGPTMIRSAAKNYQDVAIVTSPADYPAIADELAAGGGRLSPATHWQLAQKAFAATAAYDRAISACLSTMGTTPAPLPSTLDIRAPKRSDLRYGENPHQSAALYSTGSRESPTANNSMAKSSPIIIWSISTPPGNSSRSSNGRPWPLSNTPILAVALNNQRSRKAIGWLWSAIRYPHSEA